MIEGFNEILWGFVVLGLILGTGLWVTVSTRAVQFRCFPQALGDFLKSLRVRDAGFRAMCTALGATVGTGNIAGVAGAIALGGPGAVFWMALSGFLGMGLKYVECLLAVRYRERDGRAGPMYIIRKGLGKRWQLLGYLYCLFGLGAAFGVGNAAQINAVRSSLAVTGASEGFSHALIGVMAVVIALLVMGGARRVSGAAEVLVPVVGGAYILLCLAALFLQRARLGDALYAIMQGAFHPGAVTGGTVTGITTALRVGVARGTFTHEAGMGTAAIAHGGAEGVTAEAQGRAGIMEVFLDTMVICTLTALVILTSGVSIPYGRASGAELTAIALEQSFGGWVSAALCGCLVLFALATILCWGFYAGRCAEFLFGTLNWKWFGFCHGAAVIFGAVGQTGTVWAVSELLNGLMVIPNLTAVLLLWRRAGSASGVDLQEGSVV